MTVSGWTALTTTTGNLTYRVTNSTCYIVLLLYHRTSLVTTAAANGTPAHSKDHTAAVVGGDP